MKPVTEVELNAHSTAPRVTEKDVMSNIVAENFFTAGDAALALQQPDHPSMRLLTFCVLTLKNGFTVTGESACASPENFDPEIGRRLARQQAINKIWPLMGYALRDHLTYGGQSFWAQPAELGQ